MPITPPAKLPITLSYAVATDFEALVAIRIEAMRESLEHIGRFDPVRARERFRAGFNPEDTRHILHEGQRVGFVVTKIRANELLLDHLYIRPTWQSQGIGAMVLKLVFSEADRLAIPIKVGALRESASNRFYTRHGFDLVTQTEFDNHYIRLVQGTPPENCESAC